MKFEDVSAFVDGEVSSDDCDPIIDGLIQDRAAQQTWSRYHLIGNVLRSVDINNTHSSQPANVVALRQRNLRAPLAGLAIAASVAVLAVTFMLRGSPEVATPGFEVAQHVSPRPLAPTRIDSLTTAPVNHVVPVGVYDQRLNGYLVNFNEQRARLGVPGVHPYVRIVGFDAQQ